MNMKSLACFFLGVLCAFFIAFYVVIIPRNNRIETLTTESDVMKASQTEFRDYQAWQKRSEDIGYQSVSGDSPGLATSIKDFVEAKYEADRVYAGQSICDYYQYVTNAGFSAGIPTHDYPIPEQLCNRWFRVAYQKDQAGRIPRVHKVMVISFIGENGEREVIPVQIYTSFSDPH